MKNQYRQALLLMNQEISIAIDSTYIKLASVVSLEKALSGKDKLPPEKRFSDSVCELQASLFDAFTTLLKGIASPSVLTEFVTQSRILPTPLCDGLITLLNYKQDTQYIHDAPFSPYIDNIEEINDAIMEYYVRMTYCYRLKTWLCDIESGIQEYGVEPYCVPECENDESINPLKDIYENNFNMLHDELTKYLIINEDIDTENDISDKLAIQSLNKTLDNILEEQ